MSVRNALVIGGGISGLTAAAALARRGIAVEVVEIKDKLGDLGGIGLSIMGNASKALATIGAAEACVDAGMPADNFTVRNPAGEVVGNPAWPALGKPAWPNQIGIARSDFHRILADAAIAAGATVRCGVTFSSIEQNDDGAHVVFTDGSSGDFDLVIAADGIYSETRKALFADVEGPKQTGLAIWRAFARRPKDMTTTQLHFGGRHGVVGICPINDTDSYIYCIHEAGEERRDPATLHLQLREKFEGYDGPISDLAAQLDDPALVSYRPLEWMLVPGPWYRGCVVLIGDAAHANPPNIAQGAAMGIEDAVVLAEEVAAPGPVADALARFMERRWERAKIVVEASCRIANDQMEHRPGFDAAAEIARTSALLAEPY